MATLQAETLGGYLSAKNSFLLTDLASTFPNFEIRVT